MVGSRAGAVVGAARGGPGVVRGGAGAGRGRGPVLSPSRWAGDPGRLCANGRGRGAELAGQRWALAYGRFALGGSSITLCNIGPSLERYADT